MNKLQKLPVLGLIAALLWVPAVEAYGAKPTKSAPKTTMFKCKDERGRAYYSDKPGPECAQGKVHQLSRHGLTIEPRRGSDQAAGKPAGGERVSPEQRRRDKALLATYSTEGQIEEAKQRNLALPLQALKQTETKLGRAQQELSTLHGQADGYASQKKQIPAVLIEDVRGKEALVKKLSADVGRKRVHTTQIEERFEAERKRFRELTSQQAAR
ncbi:MAG: hypothetical protein ACREU7_07530 [Burkholderiales bacterium]